MDEGPEPMKDLKPVPKNPNSADQFREAHEAEYEARAKASADKVDKVLQHNTAYPKLIDKLDKRRSIVQVKPNKTHNANPKCIACDKLRQLAKLKKLKIKPRCCKSRPRRRSKSRKRHKRTKKTKTKRVTIQKTRRGDDYTRNIMKHFKNQSRNGRSNAFRSRGIEINDNPNETDSEVNSVKYPDTSEPSISSYNSHLSLNHEPLDKYMEPYMGFFLTPKRPFRA